MVTKLISGTASDLGGAVRRYHLAGTLGWQDVRQRYRRSSVGAFWLTISMGVVIGTIGIVFGQIFNSPMDQFLPFLSIGLIIWGFISTAITEGCTGFIAAEAVIKQLPIPLPVHIFRMLWRNMIILAHNIVIFPLVLVVVGKPLGWVALVSVPGFLLLMVNLLWVCICLATICARYRDIPQIVTSGLQIVFYLTPIMWLPHLLPGRASAYIIDANPFFHLIEIVRAPLLGQLPSTENWVVSLVMAVVGWVVTLLFYGKFRRRIAYWL
ncbi:ABC transporter permease [Bordetella bronchialis]|uniref:ABC transporter permease n=1 Tax=Bordetella bronchialis TaxID=463025 RepID=A0A193G310_9BORD|nr:ABC transporter permease [Bordetella bronchialis]ANN69087.1 ABC transporter permease [Bordetella bronchialis]ANN74235.1 ABC transporter permease [Bordetella bronchialis]